ncbi:MAG: hypothetical protein ACREDR_45235, partial [Blastocatellia bacterium]
PPYCFPGSGLLLAIGAGFGTHVVAEAAVVAVIGATVGPEVLITSLAFDLAFGAPIDLIHAYACGDL